MCPWLGRSAQSRIDCAKSILTYFPTFAGLQTNLKLRLSIAWFRFLSGWTSMKGWLVTSRVKECESALDSLRRRQEGATFDSGRPELYSLDKLNDLAGVRVLAFHIRTSRLRVDKFSFRQGLAECAMMKIIPQRMAYLRFGPEGSKDRGGTA
jgi:ppGpp synthetase/RelA/SpoT-type nucleotidyltranferase